MNRKCSKCGKETNYWWGAHLIDGEEYCNDCYRNQTTSIASLKPQPAPLISFKNPFVTIFGVIFLIFFIPFFLKGGCNPDSKFYMSESEKKMYEYYQKYPEQYKRDVEEGEYLYNLQKELDASRERP